MKSKKLSFSLHLEDLDPDDDLANVAIQDDAFDELQAVVNKTMKLKTKKETMFAEKVTINPFPTEILQGRHFESGVK